MKPVHESPLSIVTDLLEKLLELDSGDKLAEFDIGELFWGWLWSTIWLAEKKSGCDVEGVRYRLEQVNGILPFTKSSEALKV